MTHDVRKGSVLYVAIHVHGATLPQGPFGVLMVISTSTWQLPATAANLVCLPLAVHSVVVLF